MPKKASSGVARGLENACKKAVKRISRAAPGEKNEKKLSQLLTKHVCKNVDQKILEQAAEELADLAKKQNPKAPPGTPRKIKPIPKLKPPGGGSPSLVLELGQIQLGEGKNAKVELKLWGDPRDTKADKGIFLNLKVTF